MICARRIGGFTLIELLVVIAIIGILSTLAVYSFNLARQRGRDAKRVADVDQMRKAVELYFVDNESYPAVASATVLGGTAAEALSGAGFTAAGSTSGTLYMGQVPSNLTPGGADYVYVSRDADGTACTSEPCISYTITFSLEAITGSLTEGNHTASPSGLQ